MPWACFGIWTGTGSPERISRDVLTTARLEMAHRFQQLGWIGAHAGEDHLAPEVARTADDEPQGATAQKLPHAAASLGASCLRILEKECHTPRDGCFRV